MLKLDKQKGIYLPRKLKVKRLLVVGPPGSGKSYLLKRIGGWAGEICINPTIDGWWKLPHLSPRPREIHFSLPFKGEKECYPVYDERWVGEKKLPVPILKSILIPSKKKYFWNSDWRARLVFDFILPPPQWTLESRAGRGKSGDMRLVDLNLDITWVTWQLHVNWWLAWHLYKRGLHVIIRPYNVAYPFMFSDLIKAAQGKSKQAKLSVFPKGVEMGGKHPALGEWIKWSAPGDWRKDMVASKKK